MQKTLSSDIDLFINGKRSSAYLPLEALADMQPHAFESMAGFEAGIFRFSEHLRRLFASARTAGISLAGREEKIRQDVLKAFCGTRHAKPVFLRLMVERNRSVVWVARRTYPREVYTKGVDIVTSPVPRNLSQAIPPEAKTNQFLNGILALLDPAAERAFETIHLGSAGSIREARVWNVFMIKKHVLMTPETAGILDGVTRRFVVECALKEKIRVLETAFTRHDIWNADEAFLTNTSGGIVPIRSVDGRRIGEKVPGILTQKLTKRFKKELDLELSHIHHVKS
ncbi:MAG: hypothetical protein COV74_07360 [Candidatus Omnitrophica bacterium CG11_big_fil_rev_8_21_14_0_20_45_26]|uniref:branched-chain-amino-acid transaminase n=1 Tax=Candidatus Abzuiibacterium crystallinum TaxID=1974748 RepID=A0A2H0LNA6_9BACT|nr:MAG: hypothetical protein COV74_07360 [Candidatus Omnitrophica bacterium CG11_big_fil_rev_8_21_14_0_20_45_26]PIW65516.1 MAG: hypothetical protein COW12_01615 [Candidatus Omnitrophica bacterium CG12_big_fil_rev_8_21_14_0_65_45_16]